jgi:hypothetical protein
MFSGAFLWTRAGEDRDLAVRLQPGAAALGTRLSHTSGVCAEERGLVRLRSHGSAVRSRAGSWPSTIVIYRHFRRASWEDTAQCSGGWWNRQPVKLGGLVPLSDSLRSVAGAAGRPALFPELFPIPDPVRHLVRQRESELMREHTHLPAMVGFVRKHVAQHFQANRPRRSPAVSAKLLDAAPTAAERFRKHLRAASGALG